LFLLTLEAFIELELNGMHYHAEHGNEVL